jgi:hypothetical protein
MYCGVPIMTPSCVSGTEGRFGVTVGAETSTSVVQANLLAERDVVEV